MLAAFAADQPVLRHAQSQIMRRFLQQRLGVFWGRHILVYQFFPMFVDKFDRLLTAGINKYGADDRFADIAKHVFVLADFLVGNNDKPVQTKPPCRFGNAVLVNQTGMPLREAAFRLIGKHPIQKCRNRQPQHPVAQKLQPFVIFAQPRRIAAVSQRLSEQLFVLKLITENFFLTLINFP